ncbi:DUF2254 domain-containing protein [uncultured Microbacterium sp.]|uniref:DUF2254 domain-containing protein n=1 Tax=uncultured Microbacterium sp. TaxID=191216 RepID=UPI00260E43F4|nr:DUF2254 domain-containing protein [uncultured Microbacterium sp.]
MSSAVFAFLTRIARRVWFRASLVSLAAVVLALAAGAIQSWLPFTPSVDLGQGSLDSLLQIIASSMLAVTTFSLTAMVTAYSSAASLATPRATQLLVEDTTSQNVLSTFVGAFVYALVGIVALSTGYYGEQGRVILFFGTLVVLALIVTTLLRWIAHLATFGRMSDIIDRVEEAAISAALSYARRPTLGGTALSAPTSGPGVWSHSVGYVTRIDMAALQKVASDSGADLAVIALPGRFADAATPLVRSLGAPLDDAQSAAARRAFTVEHHRTFEQDPRLGAIALAEIASRALSPAVNDPGTAIQVIGAMERVLTEALQERRESEVVYPNVHVTAPTFADLLADAVRPLARDGAGSIEVQVRLQKTLAALAVAHRGQAGELRSAADAAWRRARRALSGDDVALLRSVRRSVWRAGSA